ncbi:M24 family metallopeptidase [Calderihabitans maritimus]|uniref:Peptidase M24 n=1 Tax=Calderihabitans maritimus TaxID=1246530 RepID=A0A1Z5HNX8_9FIRM|nr:Xaa-Pro peptidase family protein [Calderihabitans maritimus]GAW91021.1 peptidase M24 [Calderihabitans maritimus]
MWQERVRRIQNLMEERNLDLLFVVGRENLIYFVGTTQIECMALLIPKAGEPQAIVLWLDAAHVREKGMEVVPYYFPQETLVDKAVDCLKKAGYKAPRIGFEKYFVEFSVYEGLRKGFPAAEFINATELFYRVRSIKDEDEIEKIRKASQILCSGMEAAIKTIRPGISELEVLAEAEYTMLKAGSSGLPFRPQIVSGEKTLMSHPHSSNKVIQEGEVVVVHIGATYEGYCSKMCRTVALGDIPPEQERTYELLLQAQEAAIGKLRDGVTSEQVDAAAREVIAKAGFEKAFLTYIGYGVGLRQSEFYPIIGKGRKEVIQKKMVVDLLLPTIYKKGIGGPRITDTILVKDDGAEILTNYPRELIRI